VETLIELYDSHGIPPEIVQEAVKADATRVPIPDNFYAMVAQKHIAPPSLQEDVTVNKLIKETTNLPKTRMLYYENANMQKFKAKILKIFDGKYVILDRTTFYPEGGGQDYDQGILQKDNKKIEVIEVQKIGNVIVHLVNDNFLCEGDVIRGKVDWDRRQSLMRHHTSTHILMGAARRVLGEHVWQAGAQKETDKSRLDISHWERITPSQLNEIERLANSIVMKNLPVEVTWMPREEAEKAYGYKLYQGGVVPGETIRVVKINDWDVEACGGTHLDVTGEIGVIKVLHTERIQDGVERIIFASGFPALKYIQEREENFRRVSEIVNVPVEGVVKAVKDVTNEWKETRREIDRLRKSLAEHEVEKMLEEAKSIDSLKLVTKVSEKSERDYIIKIASLLTTKEPKAVIAVCGINKTAQVVVMAGEEAVRRKVHAGKIASEVAKILGGGGSGRPNFGQGGGIKVEKALEALSVVEIILKKQISGADS
jgi:alanyl-tRNA synthetase